MSKRPLLPVALALLGSMMLPQPADAGDRELAILLVNMTPDPVSDAGRTCARQFRAALRDDYTETRAFGESRIRALMSEPESDFMGWDFTRVAEQRQHAGEHGVDTIMLFDCRPDDQRLDVLVISSSGAGTTTRYRGHSLGRAQVQRAAQLALMQGWVGFSP